jgi:hypothetical protein
MFGMFGGGRRPTYHYNAAVTRAMSPRDAAVLMGSELKCRGIHVPDDPSPSKLKGKAREFWDAAYENANAYYDDPKVAKKTAWKSVRLFFHGPYGSMRPSAALPPVGGGPAVPVGDPGDLTDLGVLVEYTVIDGDANLDIRRFQKGHEPELFWSDAQKALYVFPNATSTQCSLPDLNSPEARMLQRWAQRPADCVRVIDVPEVNVQLVGNIDTLVYRSDKWHDKNPDPKHRGSQEYIHQFGDGVGIWQDNGNPPRAIAIMGGCLDVEERGIIH